MIFRQKNIAMKNNVQIILQELQQSASSVDCGKLNALAADIASVRKRGNKVYCIAAGRMLFVAQTLVMRLNQMGIKANCSSDTYVEPIADGDLIIAISSSGSTRGVVDFSSRAREKFNVLIWMIGCNPRSPLCRLADNALLFRPAGSTRALAETEKLSPVPSVQPMSSLNEQTAFLCLDALILELMETLQITNDFMNKRHFNLE